MKRGQASGLVVLLIAVLLIFGVFAFIDNKNLELSGQSIISNLFGKKTQPIQTAQTAQTAAKAAVAQSSQQTKAVGINAIPENVKSQVAGFKEKPAFQDFKTRVLTKAFQDAMKAKNPNKYLDAMQKWTIGLYGLSSNQAKELDKQMAAYIKTLSNKDAAALLSPSIALIDLNQKPFEKTELYKEYERRFKDKKSFNEMKLGFSSVVGLFLPDYNNVAVERFTMMCKKGVNSIECNPIFDQLKNYFDKTLQGLGKCNIIDTTKDAFMCRQGLVCDPSALLGTDSKAKQQLMERWGLKTSNQLRATFGETQIRQGQSSTDPTEFLFGLMNPNALLASGEGAGTIADRLCKELAKLHGKGVSDSQDQGQDKLENLLELDMRTGFSSRCGLPDAQAEIDKRFSEGNKNLASLNCFSDPEVKEKENKLAFIKGKNPNDGCLRGQGDGGFWGFITRLFSGGGSTTTTDDKESTTTTDGQNGGWKGETVDKDGRKHGHEQKAEFAVTVKTGEEKEKGDRTSFKVTVHSNGDYEKTQRNVVGVQDPKTVGGFEGRVTDAQKGNLGDLGSKDKKAKAEAEAAVEIMQAAIAGKSMGLTGVTAPPEATIKDRGLYEKLLGDAGLKDKQQAKEGQNTWEKVLEIYSGVGGTKLDLEGGSSCSASEQRMVARMKCLLSSSTFGSQPATFGVGLQGAETRKPMNGQIVNPNPDKANDCKTISNSNGISDINSYMCEKASTIGMPRDDQGNCNFGATFQSSSQPGSSQPANPCARIMCPEGKICDPNTGRCR